MIVGSEQLVQFARADAGSHGERFHIFKSCWFEEEAFNQAFNQAFPGKLTQIELVWLAFFTGSEPSSSGVFRRGVKLNVLRFGLAGLAGRQAVNSGGQHARDELAVVCGVGLLKNLEHLLSGEGHSSILTYARVGR